MIREKDSIIDDVSINEDVICNVYHNDEKVYERYADCNAIGELPLMLKKSRGKDVVDYSITGNTIQNGTPTPEQPVEVMGVGDRTANLFEGVLQGVNINSIGQIAAHEQFSCYFSRLVKGQTYTFNNAGYTTVYDYVIAYYSDIPKVGDKCLGDGRIITRNKSFVSSYDGYVCIRFNRDDWDVMLNEGSEPLPYEPYGYKIPVLCRGKNLWNRNSKVTNENGEIRYGIQVGKGVFTVSQGTARIFCRDGENSKIVHYTDAESVGTFTFYDNGIFWTTPQINPQIELGSVATSYEPYQEPVKSTIYLPTPLMKDEILKSDGTRDVKWGVKAFDGTEAIGFNANYNMFTISSSDLDVAIWTIPICSHMSSTGDIRISGTNNRLMCWIVDNIEKWGKDKEVFKSWLSEQYANGTPVTVYYQLATPTTEEVTNEPIKTLLGDCYLETDTEVQPTNMSVTYKSTPSQAYSENQLSQQLLTFMEEM